MSTHVEIKTHLWYTFISNSKTSKYQTQKNNYFLFFQNGLFICRQWPGNQRTNIEIQPKKQKKKIIKRTKSKKKTPDEQVY